MRIYQAKCYFNKKAILQSKNKAIKTTTKALAQAQPTKKKEHHTQQKYKMTINGTSSHGGFISIK